MRLTLAVDGMGGDHGAPVVVPAVLDFLQREAGCTVILTGREEILNAQINAQQRAACGERLRIQPAREVVGMHDSVQVALRQKKDSSLRVAIDLVKSGQAQAAVSAGNTGALMAIARFVLKTLPGIDRPAIASALPTANGHTTLLDLGANVDCQAEHLLQFAIMGALLVTEVEHHARPSVGLLNVGEEEIKGNDTVKEAAELLRRSGLNFYGNVEGDDIYRGTTDVVVCDGFVGNAVLKASEGLVQMITAGLREEYARNFWRKLLALFSLPALRAFRERYDHRRYNGASLLGLTGVVVKSHGSADQVAFGFALERAAEAARQQLPAKIAARMADFAAAAHQTTAAAAA